MGYTHSRLVNLEPGRWKKKGLEQIAEDDIQTVLSVSSLDKSRVSSRNALVKAVFIVMLNLLV